MSQPKLLSGVITGLDVHCLHSPRHMLNMALRPTPTQHSSRGQGQRSRSFLPLLSISNSDGLAQVLTDCELVSRGGSASVTVCANTHAVISQARGHTSEQTSRGIYEAFVKHHAVHYHQYLDLAI